MTRLLLLKPHTHAGRSLKPDDAIDTDEISAQWLTTHGIAHLERGPQTLQPETKPVSRKEAK